MANLDEPHIAAAAAAAIATRARLALPAGGPLDRDMLAIAEQNLDLPVSILKLPDGVAGAYQRRRGQGFVFLQAMDYPTRQRFTLAHEVGHHILGHRARVENSKDVGGSSTRDPNEQQANYFASEFLVPLESARSWMAEKITCELQADLEALVRGGDEFLVSPPALLYRITTAGLEREYADTLWEAVNDRQYIPIAERLKIGPGSDAIAEIYETGKLPRVPAALTDNARRAHAAGFINDQRLGEVLRTARR